VCTDLSKLICVWWFDFKLEPIFDSATVASKNDACYKSGQNWLENNHFAILAQIGETDCIKTNYNIGKEIIISLKFLF
jgi:hypothetical protein